MAMYLFGYLLLCVFCVLVVHLLCKRAPVLDFEEDAERFERLAKRAKERKEEEAIQRYFESRLGGECGGCCGGQSNDQSLPKHDAHAI